MSEKVLKKPVGVYFLALLFMLAPIGNIMISFAGSGVPQWYAPDAFMALLGTIPFFEWIWLGMLLVTGILLLKPHRLSWSIAIFSLVVVLILNAVRVLQMDSTSIDPAYLKVFSGLSIVICLSLLVIAFYFRFPYLDRRASWLMVMTRFEMKTPIKILLERPVSGETRSVSLSGCLFEVTSGVVEPQQYNNKTLKISFMEIPDFTVEASVVDIDGAQVRVNFVNMSAPQKARLKKFLIDSDEKSG